MLDKIKSVLSSLTTIGLCLMTLTALGFLGYSGIQGLLEKPVSQYQAIKDLPAFNIKDIEKNTQDPTRPDAMIALFRPDPITGKITYFCTGFAISDKLALTAGHCLVDSSGERMTTDEITIKDLEFKEIGKGKAGAINTRADMGVVVGDFSYLNKVKLRLDPGGFYGTNGPYIACGFAWGSLPAKCFSLSPQTNYFFQVKCSGELYPGMSGGPVLDEDSHEIVGINAAVTDGAVIITPTNGLIGALELKIEDK